MLNHVVSCSYSLPEVWQTLISGASASDIYIVRHAGAVTACGFVDVIAQHLHWRPAPSTPAAYAYAV
eukprot:5750084-Pleurochrysis_carterae.AAC.1